MAGLSIQICSTNLVQTDYWTAQPITLLTYWLNGLGLTFDSLTGLGLSLENAGIKQTTAITTTNCQIQASITPTHELIKGNPSQRNGASPAIEDHSVTCHPTQVNNPCLNPSHLAAHMGW